MKKALLTTVICSIIAATAAFGQGNLTGQMLSYNDNVGTVDAGTYAPSGTFTIDIFYTFASNPSFGLSYWLETETTNGFNLALTITNVAYGTAFPDPQAGGAGPTSETFTDASGADSGFMAAGRDLGSTTTFTTSPTNAQPPGTYLVNTLTFTLSGATPGTYFLQSTTASPKTSEGTDTDFNDNNLPAAVYTITIVPEPSTLALIGLTAVGGAYIARRRRALRG